MVELKIKHHDTNPRPANLSATIIKPPALARERDHSWSASEICPASDADHFSIFNVWL